MLQIICYKSIATNHFRMERFAKTLSAAMLAVDLAHGTFVRKGEFKSENIRPPVWLLGEYYTVNQGYFDQYLYIVPQVYIKMDSDYKPRNGAVVQMYASF